MLWEKKEKLIIIIFQALLGGVVSAYIELALFKYAVILFYVNLYNAVYVYLYDHLLKKVAWIESSIDQSHLSPVSLR